MQVFLTVEGNEEILPKLIVTTNKFKMFMEVFKVNSISQDYTLQITKKDSIKNERFETELKKAFTDFEKTSNISFGVTYFPATKRFQFLFPNNDRMTNMKVVLPCDLAERLGFELNREITPKKVSLVVVDPKGAAVSGVLISCSCCVDVVTCLIVRTLIKKKKIYY